MRGSKSGTRGTRTMPDLSGLGLAFATVGFTFYTLAWALSPTWYNTLGVAISLSLMVWWGVR